jgi:hypothetical protein
MDALHTLTVLEPCRRDWDQMPGDAARRFCNQCQKYVHNLSAMSSDTARDLVENRPDEFCVRFEKDEAGRLLTIDYAPAPKRRKWTAFIITFVSVITSTIGGTFAYVLQHKPPPPRVVTPPRIIKLMGMPAPETFSRMRTPSPPRQYNPEIDRLLTNGSGE